MLLTISNQKKELSLEACNDKEWLDTNGTGSYASSTLCDCHTRKYHGLLVANLLQPFGNYVLLSKFEEQLIIRGVTHPLSVNQYLNQLDEGGFAHFKTFNMNTHPIVEYQFDDFTLIKEMMILHEKNTVLIRYRLDPFLPNVSIQLRPLLAYRYYHTLAKANSAIRADAQTIKNGFAFSPYEGMPTLKITSQTPMKFDAQAYWYYDFAYLEEKARGFDYVEDLFSPGAFTLTFTENQPIIMSCSIENDIADNLTALWHAEASRRNAWEQKINEKENSFFTSLKNRLFSDTRLCQKIKTTLQTQAAPQFIVHLNGQDTSIIAGYHWFGSWGRDAMISLPGLTLYSDQANICMQVLMEFASQEYQGLIPNRISPLKNGQNEYDTIDASMWFCWTVQQYYLHTKDLDGIQKNLWETLKNIIHWYQQGTLYHIKQAENGLIYGGTPLVKTTWMDVNIGGCALTPRNGAQVEVNALWYNALRFILELAHHFKDPIADKLTPVIKLVKQNYQKIFWDPQLGYLYDFVNDEESNTQLRPNQLLAISLPYSPITDTAITQRILHAVQTYLLTPYGLRTLSPQDRHYHGHYEGGPIQRDTAYHNGTVWPWLLGPLTDALLKIHSKQEARKILLPCFNGLWQHIISQAGLGCVSEIFDGDAPFTSRGCIQQAWSVGELIRISHLLQ